MAANIIIQIGASSKQFTEELDKLKAETENLEGGLATIAGTSAVAFAALTGAVGFSVKAFAESEAASNRLGSALQQQGIYSDALVAKYKDQAARLQELTGIDDDAIVSGQAQIQSYLGRVQVTDRLSKAVADLAAAQGIDLQSAFNIVGKSIGTSTNALARNGIEVDANASKQEKMAQIIEQIEGRFSGQAEAANKGLGGIKGLTAAFGDFSEEIGSRFAPIVSAGIAAVTSFFQNLSKNKPLLDLIVSLTTAGIVVSGVGLAVGVAGIAFLKLRAALIAAKVATQATSLAFKGLLGATGLGLFVILVSEIYLNWSTVWPRAQAIFQAFTANISSLAMGLGKILLGIFSTNGQLILDGLADTKSAVLKTYAEAAKSIEGIKEAQTEQNKAQADAAAKRAAREQADRARQSAVQTAQRQLLLLELGEASKATVELKKQEVATLEKIEDDKNAAVRDKLYAHLEEIRTLQAEQRELDIEQKRIFEEEVLAGNEEFQALSYEQQEIFLLQNREQLQSQIDSKLSSQQKEIQQRLANQVKANNEYLVNEKKFGTTIAEFRKFQSTEQYEGAKQLSGELSELQESGNSKLQAIGKAAALSTIAIKTAEGAASAYSGAIKFFGPVFGPPIGIAAAGAMVAFGAEQTKKVFAAKDGGLVTGGVPGIDSVPFLLEPGELVTPSRNFDEVVNAVAAARSAESSGSSFGGNGSSGALGAATLEVRFRDNAFDLLEATLIERQNLDIAVRRA